MQDLVITPDDITTYRLKYPFKFMEDIVSKNDNGEDVKTSELFTVEELTLSRYRGSKNVAVEFYGRFDNDPDHVVRYNAKSYDADITDPSVELSFVGGIDICNLYTAMSYYLDDMDQNAFEFLNQQGYRLDTGDDISVTPEKAKEEFYIFEVKTENLLAFSKGEGVEYSQEVGGKID